MRARAQAFVLTAALTGILTGCSSGGGSGSATTGAGGATESAHLVGGVQTLEVVGSEANVFDKTALFAVPGLLRLRFQALGGTPHDLQVEGAAGAQTALISGGEHAETTFTATPGTYRFICTIHPGTMRGSLVVRAG